MNNVIGYKIHTHKSFAFPYTNNENSVKEIKETILFPISIKRKKYLQINLSKDTKDLYGKNMTQNKEIRENTNTWRDIPCSWMEKSIL